MVLRKFVWLALTLLTVIMLTACNIGATPAPTVDVNAIYTSAAATAMSGFSDQLTQTALAVPPTALPTSTPLATFTPLPTFPILQNSTPLTLSTSIPGVVTTVPTIVSIGTAASSYAVGCNDAKFTGETIPDGTKYTPGKTFTKSWDLTNVGTCQWSQGYSFAYKTGDKLNAQPLAIQILKSADVVDPGKGLAFNVQMTAPTTEGEYKGYWQMKDDKGNWFGSLVYVDIIVSK